VHKLWLAQGEERELSADETAAIDDHLTRCPTCRVESRVVRSMRIRAEQSQAQRLDELPRRRNIEQALLEASALERLKKRPAIGALPLYRNRPAIAVGLGLCAAALAVALAAVLWDRGTGIPTQNQDAQSLLSKPLGRLVLSSGQVLLSSNRVQSMEIAPKAILQVKEGMAVARLDTGVVLRLNSGTDLAFGPIEKEAQHLNMRQGALLVEVDPLRRGPPLLIGTPHGRLRVLGTVFSVDVDASRTLVRVFRSRVETVDTSGTARIVEQGQALTLGSGAVVQMPETEIAEALSRLQMLDLVAAPQAAEIEVDSLPRGASLSIDGIEVGQTPVRAAVRPGMRELSLQSQGCESVKEFLHLASEDKVARMFELRPSAALTSLSDPTPVSRSPLNAARSNSHRSATRTAEDLLDLAQSFRNDGRWNDALIAYRSLIETYPKDSLSRAALVSMGHIQLEHLNRPGDALLVFEQYLAAAQRGTLAQEATLGRAEALRALGRYLDERAVLRAFVRDFPDAIQVSRVRKRLVELE
jgi:ferric-dicitrate binding protein FerR (iron transport regulator)